MKWTAWVGAQVNNLALEAWFMNRKVQLDSNNNAMSLRNDRSVNNSVINAVVSEERTQSLVTRSINSFVRGSTPISILGLRLSMKTTTPLWTQ